MEREERRRFGPSFRFTTRSRCYAISFIMHRRYIWETYKKGEISKDVYNFCIKWKIADKDLIAMWKKKGYEKLCCMACAQKGEHIQGTTCICRVGRFICFVSIGSEGGFACWQDCGVLPLWLPWLR